MKGIRFGSTSVFLDRDVWLFQHHLLKRLSFFHCITFDPLSKITLLYLCRSVSGLYFVPLMYFTNTIPLDDIESFYP